MKVSLSSLDGETLVVEIEKGDAGQVVDMMDEQGNGYAVFGDDCPVPMAVIDGRLRGESWFTENHLLAIEAHEVGHIRTSSPEETEAEREGIRLLQKSGHLDAAEILIGRGII